MICVRGLSVLAAAMAVLACGASSPATLPFTAECVPERPVPVATGCADFTVERPRPRAGGVIRAVDYGFSPANDDNGRAINAALAAAKARGAARVELAPGVYRCFGETVKIEDFTDFTFDGKGAELVFWRPADITPRALAMDDPHRGNVTVARCVRTEVCDFKMDWDWARHPLATMMRVEGFHVDETRADASYVDYRLVDYSPAAPHPNYGGELPIMQIKPMDDARAFVPGPSVWIGNTEGHYGPKSEWLGPDRLRVWWMVKDPVRHYDPLYAPNFNTNANRVAVKKLGVPGALFRVCHAYAGKNGVNMVSNRHLTLARITIWSCYGMALVVSGEQKFWRVEDVSVEPKNARRPISSTADGNHITKSCGYAQYVRFKVVRNADDGNNFHDCFTRGVRDGDRTLRIVHPRRTDYIGLRVGDTLELAEADYSRTGFTAKVVSISSDLSVVAVDRDLPKERFGWFNVYNRAFFTQHVLLKDCTFDSVEHRGCFAVPNVTLDGCTFMRNVGDSARIYGGSYTLETFCEGGTCSNVVIRNCRFLGNNRMRLPYSRGDNGSDVASVVRLPQQVKDLSVAPSVVRGILVEGCEFVDPWGCAMDLRVGEDVVIRGNVLRLTGTALSPDAGRLRFENVRNLSLSSNRME